MVSCASTHSMENQCKRECNQGQKTNNIVDLSQESALEIFHRFKSTFLASGYWIIFSANI